MPAFTRYAGDARLTRTDELAAKVLSLPMANDLGASDIELIVTCLVDAVTCVRAGR